MSFDGAFSDFGEIAGMSSKNELLITPKRSFESSSSSGPTKRWRGNSGYLRRKQRYGKFKVYGRKAPRGEYRLNTVCLTKGVEQLFPDRYCCRMKNVYQQLFTSAAGTIWAGGIQGNALHNPICAPNTGAIALVAGTATTIYGLPNLLGASGAFNSAPYNQYRIHSAKISINIQLEAAASANCGQLVIVPVANPAFNNLGFINTYTYSNFSEMPYSKSISLSGQGINASPNINGVISTHKMYALKYKAQMEDPAYGGVVGTNPTNLWYWVYAWFPSSSGNSPIALDIHVEYWVEFFDRLNMSTGQA